MVDFTLISWASELEKECRDEKSVGGVLCQSQRRAEGLCWPRRDCSGAKGVPGGENNETKTRVTSVRHDY
jgi:hypothetical protein